MDAPVIALALASAALLAGPDDLAPAEAAREAGARRQVQVRAAIAVPLSGAAPAPATGPTTRGLVPLPPHQSFAVATVRVNPIGRFYGSLSAFRVLDAAGPRAWEPDFGWAVGWDDPAPGGLGLAFEHPGGNRWLGGGAGVDEGSLVAAWRLPVAPEWPAGVVRWDARAAYAWTPRWRGAAGTTYANKHAATLRLEATAWRRLHAWVSPWTYFQGPQQPWDPDYTWGLGLLDDTGAPGAFELRYVSATGTRLPGRGVGAGPFDGTLLLSTGWAY